MAQVQSWSLGLSMWSLHIYFGCLGFLLHSVPVNGRIRRELINKAITTFYSENLFMSLTVRNIKKVCGRESRTTVGESKQRVCSALSALLGSTQPDCCGERGTWKCPVHIQQIQPASLPNAASYLQTV